MSVSDRDKWLETFGGFESLFQIYEKAMSDADSLDFTIDEYKWFKEKYGKFLYFPEYNDDYGAYYFPTLKGTCTINFRGMSSVIRYDFYLDHQIGLRSEQIHSLYLPSNIYLLYK